MLVAFVKVYSLSLVIVLVLLQFWFIYHSLFSSLPVPFPANICVFIRSFDLSLLKPPYFLKLVLQLVPRWTSPSQNPDGTIWGAFFEHGIME